MHQLPLQEATRKIAGRRRHETLPIHAEGHDVFVMLLLLTISSCSTSGSASFSSLRRLQLL